MCVCVCVCAQCCVCNMCVQHVVLCCVCVCVCVCVREREREIELENFNTQGYSSVRSIWTYLKASPCYTTERQTDRKTAETWYGHLGSGAALCKTVAFQQRGCNVTQLFFWQFLDRTRLLPDGSRVERHWLLAYGPSCPLTGVTSCAVGRNCG